MGILAGLFAGFIVSADANINGQKSPPLDGASVFEQFKEFIANPPPIEDIVFSYQGPPITVVDSSKKNSIKTPAPIIYVRARWSPEHLLMVTAPALEDLRFDPLSNAFELKRAKMLVRSKEEFWSFKGLSRSVTYWKGSSAPPHDKGNPLLNAYFYQTQPLFGFMGMGPHFVLPQAIRWSDNRFKLTAKLPDGDFLIEGTLFSGTNGYPEKMNFRIRSASSDGKYLARYHYGTNSILPPFIPERVRSVVFHGDTEYPDKDIRILSLKLGSAGASEPDISTVRALSQEQVSQFVYTNQNLYAMEPTGELRLIPRQKEWNPPFILAYANRYYYVACALISAGFLILNLRMRRENQTKQMMKEQHAN